MQKVVFLASFALASSLFGMQNEHAGVNGQTALMLAVQNGDLQEVESLLQCRADVNGSDADGRTVLQYAEEWGNVIIADFLRDRILEERAIEEEAMESGNDVPWTQIYTPRGNGIYHNAVTGGNEFLNEKERSLVDNEFVRYF